MADTRRELIMQAIQALFEGMKEGLPVADPYETTWSVVSREPIDKLAKNKKNAIWFTITEETKDPVASGLINATMRMVIEFHLRVSTKDKPDVMLNIMLGDIQRKLTEDVTLGGLAMDMMELGNEFDIEGEYDKQVSGMMAVQIRYRHKFTDPRLVA